MTHTIKLTDLCDLIAHGNQPERITFRDRTYEYRNGRYENDVYGVLVLAFGKEYLDESVTYTDSILTNKEREYLSAVLKPWKGQLMVIEKVSKINVYEYIAIRFLDDAIAFPKFRIDEHYKGMERNRRYTPEELELWTE